MATAPAKHEPVKQLNPSSMNRRSETHEPAPAKVVGQEGALVMPLTEPAIGDKPLVGATGVKGEHIEDGERDPGTIAEEQRRRSEEYWRTRDRRRSGEKVAQRPDQPRRAGRLAAFSAAAAEERSKPWRLVLSEPATIPTAAIHPTTRRASLGTATSIFPATDNSAREALLRTRG